MKEEKEIFKPKLRITTLSENGNPLSDRLVDACTEMYAGPKVQHKGPIRIEVTLVNQQDISQFKEYLDKLSGNLPIKESAGRGRPSNTQSKELESPREDILADVEKMVNEGKSQQDIIKYLRDLGFVFILTEDFLYHFPEFKFDKKDVGEPTNNGQYLDSYSWMARCIKRAKDPKTDKFDPMILFGFSILQSPPTHWTHRAKLCSVFCKVPQRRSFPICIRKGRNPLGLRLVKILSHSLRQNLLSYPSIC
jgi:hypothetical protein